MEEIGAFALDVARGLAQPAKQEDAVQYRCPTPRCLGTLRDGIEHNRNVLYGCANCGLNYLGSYWVKVATN